jgi:hypothetical protein
VEVAVTRGVGVALGVGAGVAVRADDAGMAGAAVPTLLALLQAMGTTTRATKTIPTRREKLAKVVLSSPILTVPLLYRNSRRLL